MSSDPSALVDSWPWPAGTSPLLILQWKLFVAYDQNFPDFPPDFVPPWLKNANYIAPSRGSSVLAACIVTVILSGAVVLARLAIRWRDLKSKDVRWMLDDWFMLLSFVFILFLTIVQILLVELGGIGKQIYDNPFSAIERALQLEFADLILYISSAVFLKTSILLFLRRLATDISMPLRRVIDGTIFFNGLAYIVAIFLSFFQCKPPSASWNLLTRLAHYQCLDMSKVITAISVIFSAINLFILLLPMRLVWAQKVRGWGRLPIVIYFMLGGFAAAASITKIVYINGVYDTWNPTWNGIYVVIWNQLELTVGMLTACLPALSSCFDNFLSRSQRHSKTQVRFRETVETGRPARTWPVQDAVRSLSRTQPQGMQQAQITTEISSGDPTGNPYWEPSDSSKTDIPKYLGDEDLSEKAEDELESADILSDLASDAGSFKLVIQHPGQSAIAQSVSDSDETTSSGPLHPYYSNKKDLYQRL